MSGANDRTRLSRTRDRLARWRERHGGPGIALPDELWAEAVEVARVEGVATAARALRVDRTRLAARMREHGRGTAAGLDDEFVEVDTSRVRLHAHTVLRFESVDGERLEIELGDAMRVDVVALAEAFWARRG